MNHILGRQAEPFRYHRLAGIASADPRAGLGKLLSPAALKIAPQTPPPEAERCWLH
jgi:hypothetical protein